MEKDKGLSPGEHKVLSVDEENFVTLEMPSCSACRTCEMACGFHHTGGEFNPQLASMQIIAREDRPGYCVKIAAESIALRNACDLCEGLDMPLCVEYCREYDDLYKVLETFAKKQKELKMSGQDAKR